MNEKRESIIELLKRARAEMPVTMEIIEQQAELLWSKFNALKKQGFSDHQAIELCKGKVIQ